ncbi:MAG: hypothetical protein ACRDG5_11250 [Anaerolineales bacterium]
MLRPYRIDAGVLRPQRMNGRVRRPYVHLVFVFIAVACSPSTGDGEAPPSASPTPAPPTVNVSPTPQASVVFLSQPDDPLEAPLREWAAGRGLALRTLPLEELEGSWLSDSGVQAAIGYERDGFPPAQALESPWPVLVLEADGILAGGRVHTVGTPGERRDQAAFLVGALAGLATRSGWVGLIDSTEGGHAEVDEAGYRAGVRYGCPRCIILRWTPDEITPDALRANAIGVLFALPGPGAEAGLERAEGVDLWVAWMESPPVSVPVERMVGGVRFDLYGPLVRALEAALAGADGTVWPYAAENDGLALVDPNPEALTPGRARLWEEAWAGLRDGTLAIDLEP